MRDPQFIIFTGPMFGSKTTRMLAAIDRLRWQKRKYAAFKPKIDDRYGSNRITTHSGGSIEALEVETGAELLETLKQRKGHNYIIAVDEAFMIKGVGKVLVDLYRKGNTVIISSLQLSSWGEPFEEMKEMMPILIAKVCMLQLEVGPLRSHNGRN